jgi:hypothetical protein
MKKSLNRPALVIFAAFALSGSLFTNAAPAFADDCTLDLASGNTDWVLAATSKSPVNDGVAAILTRKGYKVYQDRSIEQKDSKADYYVSLGASCVGGFAQVPCPEATETRFEFWKNQPAEKTSYFTRSYSFFAETRYAQKLKAFLRNIPNCRAE